MRLCSRRCTFGRMRLRVRQGGQDACPADGLVRAFPRAALRQPRIRPLYQPQARNGIEGDLPEGMDLFNKFFLEVEGSKATDPTCIFQTIHIVAGDHQDRTFVRSSNDGGKTWSGWKGVGDGTIKYVTYYNVLPPVPPEDLADGGLIVIR